MNYYRLFSRQKTLTLALVWFFNGGVGDPNLTQVKPSRGVVNIFSLAFEPPTFPGKGTPASSTRRDTGTSGECELASEGESGELIALVPKSFNNGDEINRFTLESNPTFWFYVPFKKSDGLQLKFFLIDAETKTLVKEYELAPNDTLPGVVGFRLPSNQSLEINKEYRWIFALECPGTDGLIVKSSIMRIEPTPELAADLRAAGTTLNKAEVYSRYGIWYDTFTTLANLRRENPRNLIYKNEWAELLTDDDVGFDDIVDKPVVNCCNPTNNN